MNLRVRDILLKAAVVAAVGGGALTGTEMSAAAMSERSVPASSAATVAARQNAMLTSSVRSDLPQPTRRVRATIKGRVAFTAPGTAGAPKLRRESACLAKAIYFEARGESVKGQEAVAAVILARTKAPGRPKSICGVVYEGSRRETGCQFSFTCDGIADVVRDGDAWERAQRIAHRAMSGKFKSRARGATYFHARSVRPSWARRMVRVATIGTHVFYRPQ